MDKTQGSFLKALYGATGSVSAAELRAAQEAEALAVSIGESEYKHQLRLHAYLNKLQLLHFAPANEGKRSETDWRRLKAIGASPGVPDIWVLEPRKPYHGLIIELKREEGGVVSAAQEWWLESLNRRLYKAAVSWHFVQSVAILDEYLNLPKW